MRVGFSACRYKGVEKHSGTDKNRKIEIVQEARKRPAEGEDTGDSVISQPGASQRPYTQF